MARRIQMHPVASVALVAPALAIRRAGSPTSLARAVSVLTAASTSRSSSLHVRMEAVGFALASEAHVVQGPRPRHSAVAARLIVRSCLASAGAHCCSHPWSKACASCSCE